MKFKLTNNEDIILERNNESINLIESLKGLSVQGNPVKQVVVPILSGNDSSISDLFINLKAMLDGNLFLQNGGIIDGQIVDISLFGRGYFIKPSTSCDNSSEIYTIYPALNTGKVNKLIGAIISYVENILVIPEPNNVIVYYASSKLAETTSEKSTGVNTTKFLGINGQLLELLSHTSDGNGKFTLTFSDDIYRVRLLAFCNCNVSVVKFPSTLTYLDFTSTMSGAYPIIYVPSSSTTNIKVVINNEYPPSSNNNSDSSARIASSTLQIYVPDNSIDSYKQANFWSLFSSIIYPLSQYQS